MSIPSAPQVPYFSFLVCVHTPAAGVPRVNAYFNGLPIGSVVAGTWQPHHFNLPDGSKRPLTMRDLADPCPFATLAELKAALHQAVEAVEIAEPPNTAKTEST